MRISDWSSDVCSSDLKKSRSRWSGRVFALEETPLPKERSGETGQFSVNWRGAVRRRNIRPASLWRSEERRVGKSVSVRVDLGGRRIIKKKQTRMTRIPRMSTQTIGTHQTLKPN